MLKQCKTNKKERGGLLSIGMRQTDMKETSTDFYVPSVTIPKNR